MFEQHIPSLKSFVHRRFKRFTGYVGIKLTNHSFHTRAHFIPLEFSAPFSCIFPNNTLSLPLNSLNALIQVMCYRRDISHSIHSIMNTDIQNRVTYIVYCVSAFASHFGLSIKQAYSYLKRFTGISFLDECYEAEHQLSIKDAVSDL